MITTEKLEKMYEDAGKATKDWVVEYSNEIELEVDCGNWCQGGTAYIELPSGERASWEDKMHLSNCDPDTIRSIIKELIEWRVNDA